jgi:peroxiredoxin
MKKRWIAAAAAAIAIALLAVPVLLRGSLGGDAGAAAGPGCASPQGKANLDFKLKDMNGKTVNLAEYKGKVVLLNFWATWCGPCKVEIPEFVRAYTEHKDKGFVILGVSIDDTAEQLREFAAKWKMNYPVLLLQDDFEDAYGPLYAVPVSIFIDRNGSICRKKFGEVKKDELERELKALL